MENFKRKIIMVLCIVILQGHVKYLIYGCLLRVKRGRCWQIEFHKQNNGDMRKIKFDRFTVFWIQI